MTAAIQPDGVDLALAVAETVTQGRTFILVTLVDNGEIEIMSGGGQNDPPTWAEVATLLAYATQCAASEAEEESDGICQCDR